MSEHEDLIASLQRERDELKAAIGFLVSQWERSAHTHERYVQHRGQRDDVAVAHRAKSQRLLKCADELSQLLSSDPSDPKSEPRGR